MINATEMTQKKCAVIIVTHQSQAYFFHCLQALKQQTYPLSQIVVVDSGSEEVSYLSDPSITLHIAGKNIGFCEGNNMGFSLADPSMDYILFLNPDAFLTPTFVEQAVAYLSQPATKKVGALTGTLLGFNMPQLIPTGLVDSRGIFRTWHGRWYDRDQGQPTAIPFEKEVENVPALCGACMFCRREALKEVEITANEIMDSRFFMYKEDIDLSLRLRRQGWELQYLPHLSVYHCRGWQKERQKIPYHLRMLSARNEMRLNVKIRSGYYLVSCLKYLFVKWIER